jgi:hypothetical protein
MFRALGLPMIFLRRHLMRSLIRTAVLTLSVSVLCWGIPGCAPTTENEPGKMSGPMDKVDSGKMDGPMDKTDSGKMSGPMDKMDSGKMSGPMDKMDSGKMATEKK